MSATRLACSLWQHKLCSITASVMSVEAVSATQLLQYLTNS